MKAIKTENCRLNISQMREKSLADKIIFFLDQIFLIKLFHFVGKQYGHTVSKC
jgi:hypothetical protein